MFIEWHMNNIDVVGEIIEAKHLHTIIGALSNANRYTLNYCSYCGLPAEIPEPPLMYPEEGDDSDDSDDDEDEDEDEETEAQERERIFLTASCIRHTELLQEVPDTIVDTIRTRLTLQGDDRKQRLIANVINATKHYKAQDNMMLYSFRGDVSSHLGLVPDDVLGMVSQYVK